MYYKHSFTFGILFIHLRITSVVSRLKPRPTLTNLQYYINFSTGFIYLFCFFINSTTANRTTKLHVERSIRRTVVRFEMSRVQTANHGVTQMRRMSSKGQSKCSIYIIIYIIDGLHRVKSDIHFVIL